MNDWQGKNIVVLGLAKSGVSVAKCLNFLGAKIIASDLQESCDYSDELNSLGISTILGSHPDNLITEDIDLVVKSPGIPYHTPVIEKALEIGIPVVSEIEIAGHLTNVPIIGITGSNGKTTTTVLIGEILAADGFRPVVAGNIGRPLTDTVKDLESDQVLVAELSSFQLKGIKKFCPNIAILLNIEPAHLDYHQTFDDYLFSKSRIFMNQTSEDIAILNADSEGCRQIASSINSKILWFSRLDEVDEGVFVKDGMIHSRIFGSEHAILPASKLALRGLFNLENSLAAVATALAYGCSAESVRKILQTFSGVEHRLEYVKTLQDVEYYNDSKATNTSAVKKALETFSKPVVLIAGGLDRGTDFKDLIPYLKGNVKAVIAFGETKEILLTRAQEASILNLFEAKDVIEAVKTAKKIAIAGDVVLLSPACASWDMYSSFEERGCIFKQAVHSL